MIDLAERDLRDNGSDVNEDRGGRSIEPVDRSYRRQAFLSLL